MMHGIFRQKQEVNFQGKINDLQVAYNSIINTHLQVSKVVYSEIVCQPEVLAILKQAQSEDGRVRYEARQQLLHALAPVYQRLRELHIRQFHFHLPDNTSFLRFHKPEKYGDDLTDIRYSVRTVNAKLIPLWGFEEGRIKNGFRYVFPVIDTAGQHLGSVEISMSFTAIENDLKTIFGKKYHLLIDKKIVDEKVFESEKSGYMVSDLSDEYLIETSEMKHAGEHVAHEAVKKQIDDKMSRKIPFAIDKFFNYFLKF